MTIARNIRRSMVYGPLAKREKPVADHIPFARHISDDLLRTKDGILVAFIKVDGFCHQTADQADIDMKASVRNTFLRAMADSRYSVYSHIIRRRITPEAEGSFTNPFCQALNEKYMASLGQRRMYSNELYLTILRRGFQGNVGRVESLADRVRRLAGITRASVERDEIEELQQHVANIARDLSSYGSKILKVVERDGAVYSEPLEFLAQLINGGVFQPMLLPRMPLDEFLPTRRITFGKKIIELNGTSNFDCRFGAMLSIKEYSAWTVAGATDGLLRIPGELIVTQSFALNDRSPVLSKIERIHRTIAASDESGTSLETAINDARDEVINGRSVMGDHHMSIMALGNTVKEMEACVHAVTKEIQNTGMVIVREDLNAEPVFWAQLPSNFSYIARKALISSRNFCHLASFHNFAVGKPVANHWGPAIALLQTTSMTPYYFNFHRRQVGNFTVTGPTGSGKTVALSFLLAQAMRISPQPRCAFFDKDRGADPFIRALGGQYEVLQPGVPTGFNPLQLEGTSSDKAFLLNLLRFLVRPRDGSSNLSAEQEKIIENAVHQIFALPLRERKFRDVSHALSGSEKASHDDLASRFDMWCNARGWLFDNPVDKWDNDIGIFGFDLTKVLDDPDIRTAALGYIFHRIEGMLDGKVPMMIFIDEGWKILDDDKFSSFVNDKLKTIRKLNGIVGFGTQSAKDIVSSRHAHTLLEQTPTNIFFPNKKADEQSYIRDFKLSRVEFDWILNTPEEARQFLIKHDHDSVIATLDLSTMLDFVKVLSGTEASVAECEMLRERYGEEPENWLPHFCGWSVPE